PGARVDRHAPRIAAAHRKDLGPRLRRAGRKEVALREFVSAVRFRTDPNDLAVETVRIRRRLLRVPWRAAFALVDRRITVRVRVRMRVVACRKIEAAIRSKLD